VPGWTIHGSRRVYASDWVDVDLVDVEAPDGYRVREHHAVRVPQAVAGCVIVDTDAVLLMWRHRFIPGSTGWEVPAGRLDPGEHPAAGAARETLEETGYRVSDLTPLARWHPSPGLTDQTFHAFLAGSARRVADPVDTHEAERIEFVGLAEATRALDAGAVTDGMTVMALHALMRRRGTLHR
jgi:8-oxo-dGTP pyrophosphatase MutT (NUDIX family)